MDKNLSVQMSSKNELKFSQDIMPQVMARRCRKVGALYKILQMSSVGIVKRYLKTSASQKVESLSL